MQENFNYGVHTFIGDHFFANFNLLVMDDGKITIGNPARPVRPITEKDSKVM